MSELESKIISFLRFPMSVLVIFVHSMNTEFSEFSIHTIYKMGQIEICIFDTVKVSISRIIGHIAVPMFLLISGCLFFKKLETWNKVIWIEKLKKRVNSLAIPYIIWNIMPIIVMIGLILPKQNCNILMMEYITSIWDRGVLSTFWNARGGEQNTYLGFKLFVSTPENTPLWFMRDLMVLLIFSPLIHWFLKKMKYVYIVLCFLLFLLIGTPSTGVLLFFSVGAYISIFHLNFITICKKNKRWIIPLFFGASIFKIYFYGSYTTSVFVSLVNSLSIISGIVCVFLLTAFLVEKKNWEMSSLLTSSSFYVFAMHMHFLVWSRMIYFSILPDKSEVNVFIAYLFAPISATIALTMTYYLLQRFFPKLTVFICGNR